MDIGTWFEDPAHDAELAGAVLSVAGGGMALAHLPERIASTSDAAAVASNAARMNRLGIVCRIHFAFDGT